MYRAPTHAHSQSPFPTFQSSDEDQQRRHQSAATAPPPPPTSQKDDGYDRNWRRHDPLSPRTRIQRWIARPFSSSTLNDDDDVDVDNDDDGDHDSPKTRKRRSWSQSIQLGYWRYGRCWQLPWWTNRRHYHQHHRHHHHHHHGSEKSSRTRRRRRRRRWPIATWTLALFWVVLLWWGEGRVFHTHIDQCHWRRWEDWVGRSSSFIMIHHVSHVHIKLTKMEKIQQPSDATPHHLILIADPQLIDPHTYPGRPWPLSTLTTYFTDLYLLRAFTHLQKQLNPDTVYFLGDLFDGGREWSTSKSVSPEQRYRGYDDAFWLAEYRRFERIFFDPWIKHVRPISSSSISRAGDDVRMRMRKMITTLPGNHDLGFGQGIQLPVRHRFWAYFGDGNRVDVIGNHTLVGVDTTSLSAFHQMGDAPFGDASSFVQGTEQLWKPTMEFLGELGDLKSKAVMRELDRLYGRNDKEKWPRRIWTPTDEKEAREYNEAVKRNKNKRLQGEERSEDDGDNSMAVDFPTVLMSHVPLYRPAGTKCGPLREHWPATPTTSQSSKATMMTMMTTRTGKDGEIGEGGEEAGVDLDDRNAIAIRKGYQYQNVLTPEISRLVLDFLSTGSSTIISGTNSSGSSDGGGSGNVKKKKTRTNEISGIFSGDDHDYCEVVYWTQYRHHLSSKSSISNDDDDHHHHHDRVTDDDDADDPKKTEEKKNKKKEKEKKMDEEMGKWSGIKDITVKSISWAMGVRHPGFMMVSLWNPVDALGRRIPPGGGGGGGSSTISSTVNVERKDDQEQVTIQSHQCILPDQLAIYILYLVALFFSIFLLILCSLLSVSFSSSSLA